MFLWGRNQSLNDGNVGNGYLLESTLHFLSRNYVWGRIENADRTNELLIGESYRHPGSPSVTSPAFRLTPRGTIAN